MGENCPLDGLVYEIFDPSHSLQIIHAMVQPRYIYSDTLLLQGVIKLWYMGVVIQCFARQEITI